MRYFSLILIGVFFSGVSAFSQEKYTRHTVAKGETISGIAEQYNVKPKAIYEINPKAKKLLKLKSVLLIPTKPAKQRNTTPEAITDYSEKTHEVLVKETPYGIAKQYGISVADLEKVNPTIKERALKIGQKIAIPVKGESKSNPIVEKENPKAETAIVAAEKPEPKAEIAVLPQPTESNIIIEEEITREVLPKETKYAIAKQYGITVKELERQNPKIKKRLAVGYKLTIRGAKVNNANEAAVVKEAVAANETAVANDTAVANEAVVEIEAVVANNDVAKESFNYHARSFDTNFLDQLVSTASENIGTRYRSGGTSKAGFDCSGLVYSTFGSFDIKLPRSSFEQSSVGAKINAEEAQKGDLIFFKTNGRRRINHVGMVIEAHDGEIKFIHSSNHGGVIISSTKEAYYGRNFVQVNRVLQ